MATSFWDAMRKQKSPPMLVRPPTAFSIANPLMTAPPVVAPRAFQPPVAPVPVPMIRIPQAPGRGPIGVPVLPPELVRGAGNVASAFGGALARGGENYAQNVMLHPEQFGDESRARYLGRTAVGAIPRTVSNLTADLGGSVAGAFNYLAATPNDNIENAFRAMVMQESGGNQSAVSNKGAVGVAQVMPGTGPEAARLAGLPWDPQRYKNDANYNYQLGLAYYKKQVADNGGDVFKAMAAYNAGPGRLQQAINKSAETGQPYTAFLPTETQQYIPKVLQRMGALAETFGAPPPAFNAAPYQNAMAAQDRAAALMMKPFDATYTETPLPERPKPEEQQAPDFSASDAAFEQARPVNPFDDPKEKVRIQRQGFFKGIGQAMAALSGGEGIGTMLMKIGAGGLAGRSYGDERVEEKEAQFERSMQAYNLALANREEGKATTLANVLNANIQTRNQYADQLWQDNVKEIQRLNPQVVGGNLVTFSKGENGQTTMHMQPLGYGPLAEAELNKANIGVQMGQASAESSRFAYQAQQSTARTALGVATQMSLQQGDGNAGLQGIMTQAASQARAAVQADTWRNLFADPRRAQQLEETARAQAYQSLGIELGKDGLPTVSLEGSGAAKFAEAYEDRMTAIIYGEAMRLGQMDKLLTNSAGRNALQTQRSGTQKTSTRTDWRGRTSESTSWSLGD